MCFDSFVRSNLAWHQFMTYTANWVLVWIDRLLAMQGRCTYAWCEINPCVYAIVPPAPVALEYSSWHDGILGFAVGAVHWSRGCCSEQSCSRPFLGALVHHIISCAAAHIHIRHAVYGFVVNWGWVLLHSSQLLSVIAPSTAKTAIPPAYQCEIWSTSFAPLDLNACLNYISLAHRIHWGPSHPQFFFYLDKLQ